MSRKSFTMLETMIVLVITSVILGGITAFSLFFITRVRANLERSNMYNQVMFALEDVKSRCLSSVSVNPLFELSSPDRDQLEILGENNIYQISPEDITLVGSGGSKAWYRYRVDGDFVLERSPSGSLLPVAAGSDGGNAYVVDEVLIDERFNPQVRFFYTAGDPPNFLGVEITVTGDNNPEITFTSREGLRFWFINVVE